MGEYKVVFRIDSETDQDGRGLTWEPGCPLSFVALQVSRDVDSGRAFLQAKVWNISAEQVSSFKGELSCSFKDGSEERFPVEFLDADIASREKYTLKPVELPRGDAVFVTGRIVELSTTSGDWRSSSEPSALPQGRLLDLTEKALRERALQLEQRRCRASVAAAPYAVEARDGWTLCACGQASVGMESCPSCGLVFGGERSIEEEKALIGLANERARRLEEEEAARKKRNEEIMLKAKKAAPLAVALVIVMIVAAAFSCASGMEVSRSKDSMQPYLEYLGFDISGKTSLSMNEEDYERLEMVELMGSFGTVSHHYLRFSSDEISSVVWTANDEMAESEYEEFLGKLDSYFGEKAVEDDSRSYWMDEDESCVAYAERTSSGVVSVEWDLNEEMPD